MATREKEQVPAASSGSGTIKDGLPRLAWASKPATVERVSLPFQVVETINESRATREAERGSLFAASGDGKTASGWRNKLIWGDNKLVTGSLRQDYAGQVKLIYIDPPFDTGADFSYRVSVGDTTVTKLPSILEEHAYRDTWGLGRSSYLTMLYERLVLMHELLAEDGLLFLHIGPGVNHLARILLDEVFGAEHFRNEVVWKRTTAHSDAKALGSVHETILVYSKSESWTWNTEYVPYDEEYVKRYYRYTDDDGRRWASGDVAAAGPGPPRYFKGELRNPPPGSHWRFSQEKIDQLIEDGRIYFTKNGFPRYKRYLDEMQGMPLQDLWIDILPVVSWSKEGVGYDTQKPEALLERIVKLGSDPGDLVGDFFVGSGTAAVAAERLNRRWIACDIGRFAVHTARKRLLNLEGCKPFEILNLGSYERQHWQQAVTGGEINTYLNFILSLYDAEPVEDYRSLHGKKQDRLVHVGAVDAPVTIDEIEEVMDELADNDLRAADVLGWEWEMGLHDVVTEQARRRGLDLACRQIPREVMKAGLDDNVRFFELAYLDLEIDRQAQSVRVQLRDFVIPSDELIPEAVRSKIAQWSDYIDYWSVDFNFRDDTFHNEWQTYRTREEPRLATESDWHDYAEPGRYAVVIKVIDIFGNDTTKLAEVRIK